MPNPLVSTIIPTYGRPQFLHRAVESALAGHGDSAEVVVVPNGNDDSWKRSLLPWQSDRRVRASPIMVAHGNIARNHGMALAAGVFVRFLDDDDYLYPGACVAQLNAAIRVGADISSADMDVVSASGTKLRTLNQPETPDFVVACLGPRRMAQPAAHLLRRAALVGITWEEERSVRQDTAFMIRLASTREFHWHRHGAPVGAWVQHANSRVSRGRDPGSAALKATAELIQGAYDQLAQQRRLTDDRRIAAADGLWSSLQKGLRYDYSYWRAVARMADSYAPGRRPPSMIHKLPVAKLLPPLLIESLLIPVRFAYHPVRWLLRTLGIHQV